MNTSARLVSSTFASAALALGLVSSCLVFSPRFQAQSVSHLKPGYTTAAELLEQFGDPKYAHKDNLSGRPELHFTYGPDDADYDFWFGSSDRLVGFNRVMHTGCILIRPGPGSEDHKPMNVRIPLVDLSAPLRFAVGTTTQAEAADALGACRAASCLKDGGFRMIWGPQFDQWVLDFDARGILSSPPTHEVRPERWNAEGV